MKVVTEIAQLTDKDIVTSEMPLVVATKHGWANTLYRICKNERVSCNQFPVTCGREMCR